MSINLLTTLHTRILHFKILLIFNLPFSYTSTYPPCQEKTSAVAGSIVGKANLHAIAGQFMGIGSSDNIVSFNAGISNLCNDITIGDAHHQAEN